MPFPPGGEDLLLPKQGEMLGEIGLTHPQTLCQVIDAPLPIRQLHEELKPDGMAQNPKASCPAHHLFSFDLFLNIHDIRILQYYNISQASFLSPEMK